jgi:hypothetical protein
LGYGRAPIADTGFVIPHLTEADTPSGFNDVREPLGGSLVGQFMATLGSQEGQRWWAQLSGVSHGTTYALLQHLVFEIDEKTQTVVGRQKLSTESAVRTAYVAADAFLGAAEIHAILFGFEADRVANNRQELLQRMIAIR